MTPKLVRTKKITIRLVVDFQVRYDRRLTSCCIKIIKRLEFLVVTELCFRFLETVKGIGGTTPS